MQQFQESIYQLIVETSTNLPGDVRKVINQARELEDQNVDSSLILFSMWTESLRHMAENGKGNVLFLDGSPQGMEKQMQDLLALQQLNTVAQRPPQ